MNKTHGYYGTPTYTSWAKMKERCNNPKATHYQHYGGRGIRVCDRWNLFENFLSDMGDRPAGTSLERVDNDRDYEPDNCIWIPKGEQTQNTRVNIFYWIGNERVCQAAFARALGVDPAVICLRRRKLEAEAASAAINRLDAGWIR